MQETGKRILVEYVSTPLTSFAEMGESLTESGGREQFHYLKGLFLEGDIQNQNGRIYPATEIQSAVTRLNEKIKRSGPIAGELDHPDGMNLNFDRLAVAILNMDMRGANGHGVMRVVKSAHGKTVEAAIEAGIKVGVSSRGTGNVDGNGRVRDFDILTIDVVLSPSAPNAYPTASLGLSGLMGENQETYGKRSSEIRKLADMAQDDASADKYLAEELKRLISSLGNGI